MLNKRKIAIPYYVQVFETIIRRIREGEYRPGELIPPAGTLQKEFAVSDITIRKALDHLVQKGFIVRTRGFGTIVTEREESESGVSVTGNFREWLDYSTGRPIKLEVDVLELATTLHCPAKVRKTLKLEPEDYVWRMKRTRKAKGEILSYFINYGHPDLFYPIKKEEAKKRNFVELVPDRCGVHLSKVKQVVEATVADMDLADILAIDFGDPIFFVVNTYYSSQSEPVAVTHAYFRGDRYKYTALTELG